MEHTIHEDIALELYRLIDFYILFPHLLKYISPLPNELRSYKRHIANIPEPFESIRNANRIMHELESIQTVSIHNLLAKQVIDIASFKNKRLKRTTTPLPSDLNTAIQSSDIAKNEWFRMVVNKFPLVNFGGRKGLKKRTGLMEFRYDMETS